MLGKDNKVHSLIENTRNIVSNLLRCLHLWSSIRPTTPSTEFSDNGSFKNVRNCEKKDVHNLSKTTHIHQYIRTHNKIHHIEHLPFGTKPPAFLIGSAASWAGVFLEDEAEDPNFAKGFPAFLAWSAVREALLPIGTKAYRTFSNTIVHIWRMNN